MMSLSQYYRKTAFNNSKREGIIVKENKRKTATCVTGMGELARGCHRAGSAPLPASAWSTGRITTRRWIIESPEIQLPINPLIRLAVNKRRAHKAHRPGTALIPLLYRSIAQVWVESLATRQSGRIHLLPRTRTYNRSCRPKTHLTSENVRWPNSRSRELSLAWPKSRLRPSPLQWSGKNTGRRWGWL